jgi:hypothetical protein
MSVCGNSIDFCNKLQTEIYTYPFAIQTILLKSLIAVSMRIAYKVNFGENDRNLIYRALEDNDPDVRIAGLIALGDKFSENDALYIFDIYNNSSDEIKYYIVNKFLSIPNIGLFNIFLLQFIKNFQSEELELYLMEMFGFIQNFISEIDDKVIEVFFEELLNTLINIEYIEVSGIFESIKNIHSELFDIVLRKCIAKSTAPKLQKFNLLSEYLTKL